MGMLSPAPAPKPEFCLHSASGLGSTSPAAVWARLRGEPDRSPSAVEHPPHVPCSSPGSGHLYWLLQVAHVPAPPGRVTCGPNMNPPKLLWHTLQGLLSPLVEEQRPTCALPVPLRLGLLLALSLAPEDTPGPLHGLCPLPSLLHLLALAHPLDLSQCHLPGKPCVGDTAPSWAFVTAVTSH